MSQCSTHKTVPDRRNKVPLKSNKISNIAIPMYKFFKPSPDITTTTYDILYAQNTRNAYCGHF